MKNKFQEHSHERWQVALISFRSGVAWGLVGGLVGTLIMDLVLMGALTIMGLPPLTCFSIVGNTVARFFSILGVEMPGGIALGVATHYLIGSLVGGIFGIAVVQIDALRADSLKKGMLLAVLYVEILSQPILALTPILLKMSTIEIVQWFSGSFVMHFLLGIILGAVVYRGLNPGNLSGVRAFS